MKGLDPCALARDMIRREGGPERARRPFAPAQDRPGPCLGRGDDDDWGPRLAAILQAIRDKDVAVIRREYDRAVRTEHPGRRGGWTPAFAETQWLRLRSAFPSARFEVHHVIGREDPHLPRRAAVRWSLTGAHDGTGAPVHVMGIARAEWGPFGPNGRGLRRDFAVLDELAIWKQIRLHTGDTA